jgi:AcrR family transcriptional regulator
MTPQRRHPKPPSALRPPGSSRSPGTLGPEIVDEIQRARIVDSLIATAAEHGYGTVTVERIIRHAHMSARTFYALFEDREACLLAAYEASANELRAGLLAAWEVESRWPDKVRRAITAVIGFIVEYPNAARLLAVEIQAGGPKAQALQAESVDRLSAKLREGRRFRPTSVRLNASTEQTVIAGAIGLIGERLLAEPPDRLRACEPELVELALAPYLGRDEARQIALS